MNKMITDDILCIAIWTWSFVFIFLFVFVCIHVLCFCAATDFSVNKDLYIEVARVHRRQLILGTYMYYVTQ